MTTNAIYFTDLHINKYSQFSETHDRVSDCLRVIDDVFKYARYHEAKVILFGGDLGDLPKFMFTDVLNKTLACFAKWFAKMPDVTLYAISGNHDQNQKNFFDAPADTLLTTFSLAFPGRFVLIDNEAVFLSDKVAIAGIPYYEHKSCFDTALDSVVDTIIAAAYHDNTKVTLLIHQTPEGLPNKNIKAETSPSDPRYFAFDMILDGHIHTSQRLTDKFLIGGNPLHRDLGDIGNEKGIWLLDLSDPANTTEFISRKGRYPEFIRKKQSEITDEDRQTSFVVPVMDAQEVILEGSADASEFASHLAPADLMTNYFHAMQQDDEKLLKVGLALLNN